MVIELRRFLIDIITDTEFVIGFQEAIEFIAVMIKRILLDDIGHQNRLANVSFILEFLHKLRIVEIQNVLSHLLDALDVFIIFQTHNIDLRRNNRNLRFDIDLIARQFGLILKEKGLFVMQSGIFLNEFVSFFDKQHKMSDDRCDKAVLIGLDFIISPDIENLVRYDIALIRDFLDELGVTGKMLDRIRIRLSGKFDRHKILNFLSDKTRIIDNRADIWNTAFNHVDPGRIIRRGFDPVDTEIGIFTSLQSIENLFRLIIEEKIIHHRCIFIEKFLFFRLVLFHTF